MKKILNILLTAALAALMPGCAKPDAEFLHDDCTVKAIYMVSVLSGAQIAGDIDDEAGTIRFTIPKADRKKWQDDEGFVTRVKLRATIPYDAVITPSLLGQKDLINIEEPVEITVTATQTGRTKTYNMKAAFSRH